MLNSFSPSRPQPFFARVVDDFFLSDQYLLFCVPFLHQEKQSSYFTLTFSEYKNSNNQQDWFSSIATLITETPTEKAPEGGRQFLFFARVSLYYEKRDATDRRKLMVSAPRRHHPAKGNNKRRTRKNKEGRGETLDVRGCNAAAASSLLGAPQNSGV